MAAHDEPWLASGEAILPRCKKCKQIRVPPRPDPCLGTLAGVTAADCGHGRDDHVFVVVVSDDGSESTLYAEEALAFFAERGVGRFGDVSERGRNTV